MISKYRRHQICERIKERLNKTIDQRSNGKNRGKMYGTASFIQPSFGITVRSNWQIDVCLKRFTDPVQCNERALCHSVADIPSVDSPRNDTNGSSKPRSLKSYACMIDVPSDRPTLKTWWGSTRCVPIFDLGCAPGLWPLKQLFYLVSVQQTKCPHYAFIVSWPKPTCKSSASLWFSRMHLGWSDNHYVVCGWGGNVGRIWCYVSLAPTTKVATIRVLDFPTTIGRPSFSIAPSGQSSYIVLRARTNVLSNDETNLTDESSHSRLLCLQQFLIKYITNCWFSGQGWSVNTVGVDLDENRFSHGQLYGACSRAEDKKQIIFIQ